MDNKIQHGIDLDPSSTSRPRLMVASFKPNDADAIVGSRPFIDGSTRPVYLDANGRQYILDHGDTPIHGTWLQPNEYDDPNLPAALQRGGSDSEGLGFDM